MLLEQDPQLQAALTRDLGIEDVPVANQPTPDDVAFSIVMRNIQMAESEMQRRALPATWAQNETLYHAIVPKATWSGTKTPRASIGVPLVLEHINSVNPQVMDVIWEEDPPFAFDPRPGTTMNQARGMEALLRWALDVSECETEMEGTSFSSLLHGSGIAKSYWRWDNDAKYWCPKFDYLERKHVLVDASLRRPDIRKGRWRAHREYMTLDQLDRLRGKDGYDIPDKTELMALGIIPREEAVQSAIESTSTITLTEFDQIARSIQTSADPSHHRLEVMEYVDDHFIWTVLNGKRLIRKVPKKNRVQYYSAYFIRSDGLFDGIGIAGLNGNEQRLQQGLLGLLLDNLSLVMHGIWKRKRGSTVFPQQIRIEPGKVIDVDEMADFDSVRQEGLKPEAFAAISDSDSRAQRRSGANEVAVQGNLPQTSGGIGRTGAGMNMLAQAVGVRMRRYVKILEQQVLVPYLEWLQDTFQTYLTPNQIETILGKELMQELGTTPEEILKARLKFQILGPTKMKRRTAALQSMPVLINFYQQDPVQSALKAQFKKVDFNQVNKMWTDATGFPVEGNLVIDMDEQEQMQVASENPLVQQLIQQKAMIQLQTQGKIQVSDAENAGRMVRDMGKEMVKGEQDAHQRQMMAQQMMGAMSAHQQVNQTVAASLPPGVPPPPSEVPPVQGAPVGSKKLG